MYLVDTSVWIDYLRQRQNPSVVHFSQLLDQGMPFGITGLIYQEILQGAASITDFDKLAENLSTQQFYDFSDNILSYQLAAKLYFNCRRKGLTIRSPLDCCIAQIAIEHNLILLHNDSDYVSLASVTPELKLYPAQVKKNVTYTIQEEWE